MYALVTTTSGVTDTVSVYDDDSLIIEKLNRWLPELREGRVTLNDYGYKRGVVSENGLRTYEIFVVANKKADD